MKTLLLSIAFLPIAAFAQNDGRAGQAAAERHAAERAEKADKQDKPDRPNVSERPSKEQQNKDVIESSQPFARRPTLPTTPNIPMNKHYQDADNVEEQPAPPPPPPPPPVPAPVPSPERIDHIHGRF